MCDKILKEALEFMKFVKIPTMKELHTKYLKMSLEKHPDKNGSTAEATEDYQKLQNFYRLIGDYIVKMSDEKPHDNDEDRDYIALFKSFNFDQKNKFSHTIFIQNEFAYAWKNALTEKYGVPEDKRNNGWIFKCEDFIVDNTGHSVTVTLYIMPKKDKKSKLHIQNPNQLINDEYIITELPQLYAEVRKVNLFDAIGAGDSDGAGAVTGAGAKLRSTRGRPPKESAKNITKNIIKYCKVQACKYSSMVTRDLTLHSRTAHKNKFDKQRQLDNEDENQMEIEMNDIEDVDENNIENPCNIVDPTQSNGFQFQDIQLKYIAMRDKYDQLKTEFEDNRLQLEEKIEDLENVIKIQSREMKRKDTDMKVQQKEYDLIVEKVEKLQNENTLLRSEVKTHQNTQVADMLIQQKYEDLLEVIKDSENRKSVENCSNDDYNIEAIVQNKNSGYRKTTPSDAPVPLARKNAPKTIKCNMCDYKASDENSLKIHIDHKHFKCDLCSQGASTPAQLRNHIETIHKKKNGTLLHCGICHFGALNENHLQLHKQRHHKQLQCRFCDFSTKIQHQLSTHMSISHKKNFTCKFWKKGVCTKVDCLYKHEIVWCKFDQQCINRNCKFEHRQSNTNKPKIDPWINPAFLNKESYSTQFPFLGSPNTCQCPKRKIGA